VNKYTFTTDDLHLIIKIITGFYGDSVDYQLISEGYYKGLTKNIKYTCTFTASTPERVLSYMWQQEWENNHCNTEILSIRGQLIGELE
jgi:hypothetical protein